MIRISITLCFVTLFCTLLLFCSCRDEADVLTDELHAREQLALRFRIGGYLPFVAGANRTRAVGTPDEGKTQWTAGDKIFVRADFYIAPRILAMGETRTQLTYEYDGERWQCVFGNTVIPPYKNEATGRYLNYKAVRILCYYMPTHEWYTSSSGRVYLYPINNFNDYGTKEAFSQVIERIEEGGIQELDFDIDFSAQMNLRGYSRLRVVTSPNRIVTLNWGEGFRDATRMALDESGTTTVTWDVQTKGKTRSDANGNAFFYGKWEQPATFSVTIERPLGNYAEYVKDGSFAVPAASIDGVSYTIDMR